MSFQVTSKITRSGEWIEGLKNFDPTVYDLVHRGEIELLKSAIVTHPQCLTYPNLLRRDFIPLHLAITKADIEMVRLLAEADPESILEVIYQDIEEIFHPRPKVIPTWDPVTWTDDDDYIFPEDDSNAFHLAIHMAVYPSWSQNSGCKDDIKSNLDIIFLLFSINMDAFWLTDGEKRYPFELCIENEIVFDAILDWLIEHPTHLRRLLVLLNHQPMEDPEIQPFASRLLERGDYSKFKRWCRIQSQYLDPDQLQVFFNCFLIKYENRGLFDECVETNNLDRLMFVISLLEECIPDLLYRTDIGDFRTYHSICNRESDGSHLILPLLKIGTKYPLIGCNLDTRDEEGRTPLYLAVNHDDSDSKYKMVIRLLRLGSQSLDVPDNRGVTPLMNVIQDDVDYEMAKFLYGLGATLSSNRYTQLFLFEMGAELTEDYILETRAKVYFDLPLTTRLLWEL